MDTVSYRIDKQFLWGPALLISPILEQVGLHVYRTTCTFTDAVSLCEPVSEKIGLIPFANSVDLD